MADREKLIELLGEDTCHRDGCYDCDYDGDRDACIEYLKISMADHLLANGVRLKENQATSDENKRWIPVTERLPERGQEVIVFSGGYLKPNVFAYHFWSSEFNSWQGITHWMPMPEFPREDDND